MDTEAMANRVAGVTLGSVAAYSNAMVFAAYVAWHKAIDDFSGKGRAVIGDLEFADEAKMKFEVKKHMEKHCWMPGRSYDGIEDIVKDHVKDGVFVGKDFVRPE